MPKFTVETTYLLHLTAAEARVVLAGLRLGRECLRANTDQSQEETAQEIIEKVERQIEEQRAAPAQPAPREA